MPVPIAAAAVASGGASLAPLLGLGTGLFNAISDIFSSDARNQQIEELINTIREMKISPNERDIRLDAVSDVFNTDIMETLNTTSVGAALSGIVNPELLRANVMANLLGEKGKAILAEGGRLDEINRSLDLEIIKLGSQKETADPIGSFVSGGLAGAGLGLQFDSYLDTLKEKDKYANVMDLLNEDLDVEIPNNLFDLDLGSEPELFQQHLKDPTILAF